MNCKCNLLMAIKMVGLLNQKTNISNKAVTEQLSCKAYVFTDFDLSSQAAVSITIIQGRNY